MNVGVDSFTWPTVLNSLLAGEDLRYGHVQWAIEQVMSGDATPAQVAGFLIALRAKGEVSVTELSVLADTMVSHAIPVSVPGETLDIVGTGGDMKNTVNISTMASLAVAATGRKVVKHGSRSASSACGAADVVEALGVKLLPDPQDIAAVAEQVGITFCFAQMLHPSMRHVAGVRRELGVPTIFNILGPLANPARPTASALGVADAVMAPTMAQVLARQGSKAWVFRGDDGMDEISTVAPTTVWVVTDGTVEIHWVDPRRLGITAPQPSDLVGGDAQHNAVIVRETLAGKTGPIRDAVVLNAAGAIVAAQGLGSRDMYEALTQTMHEVSTVLDNGAAADLLERWITVSASISDDS